MKDSPPQKKPKRNPPETSSRPPGHRLHVKALGRLREAPKPQLRVHLHPQLALARFRVGRCKRVGRVWAEDKCLGFAFHQSHAWVRIILVYRRGLASNGGWIPCGIPLQATNPGKNQLYSHHPTGMDWQKSHIVCTPVLKNEQSRKTIEHKTQ